MPLSNRHDYVVIDLIQQAVRNIKAQPVNLGGFGGPGGGNGIPPGGFIGQLIQTEVAYDTTEAGSPPTVGSGSLVDNLNHIRWRLGELEAGSGVLVVDQYNGGGDSVSPTSRISFSGALVTDLGGGRALVSISGGGGGLDTAAGDARYLKLVADNDPLTGRLSIIPTADNTDGLYIETQGDAYGADIEQFGYGGENITTPGIFLFRGDGDSSNPDYSAFAIEIQDDVPATANNNGGFLKYILNGASIFSWNPRASATTVAYSMDTMIARTTGKVLLIRDADNAVFGVVQSGAQIFGSKYLELGVDVSKEVNAGKIGYETFDSGYLNIVGAGTVAGSRKVKIYDDLEVSDSLSASDMNLTNPSAVYNINGSPHTHSFNDLTNKPTAVTNANDIFRVDSVGTSGFTGTINGTPSGTSVVYNVSSGQENSMVPQSTSQLGKQRLYNTTRGNHALISNCNTGTNTITLTATVPANWASGDTITTLSQTVSGGGFSFVDIEITSGELVGKTSVFLLLVAYDSAVAFQTLRVHPFETYSDAKLVLDATSMSTSAGNTEQGLYKLVSNIVTCSWSASGAATGLFIIRQAGYLS